MQVAGPLACAVLKKEIKLKQLCRQNWDDLVKIEAKKILYLAAPWPAQFMADPAGRPSLKFPHPLPAKRWVGLKIKEIWQI